MVIFILRVLDYFYGLAIMRVRKPHIPVNLLLVGSLLNWGTGVKRAGERHDTQEPSVVTKLETVELGASNSMECNIFPFIALTLLVG